MTSEFPKYSIDLYDNPARRKRYRAVVTVDFGDLGSSDRLAPEFYGRDYLRTLEKAARYCRRQIGYVARSAETHVHHEEVR